MYATSNPKETFQDDSPQTRHHPPGGAELELFGCLGPALTAIGANLDTHIVTVLGQVFTHISDGVETAGDALAAAIETTDESGAPTPIDIVAIESMLGIDRMRPDAVVKLVPIP